MNKNKKFTYWLIILLSCFVCVHLILWQFTKKVYPNNHVVGDLARMSYKFDLINLRNNIDTLEKKHINFKEYENEEVDVITIGDSFSNGAGGGENRYYQDYISSKFDFKVLNIPDISDKNNYIDSILLLLNSDFFDKVKPKYIILECVQRNVHLNIGLEKLNSNYSYVGNIFGKIKKTKDIFNSHNKYKDNISFINNLNYNLVKYNLKFYLNGYGRYKNYYIEKLNKNMFSSEVQDELMFFRDDIDFIKYQSKNDIIKLNSRMNELARLLKEKGIVLYFMPAVDKYNLYRDNLVNKDNYPKSLFFEYLRNLDKDYIFIDTKKILLEELNKSNVLDLYHSDDTHWNTKARKLIVDNLDFNNEGN
ncbi:hypothetical protein [Arcobacter peruensis]|uniref:hypothetical protein n=1 Tax=Arcobacter peruensis TaxID=2320140 RepID=UPI000F073B28|nr:hypothetical protein [Arcobacter peruensis]